MSNAFTLDKTKIKLSFALASATYDTAAAIQRQVGKALLNTFEPPNMSGVLLDLGCGTGFLTYELLNLSRNSDLQTVVALDFAWPMIQQARIKLANRQHQTAYLCADAEHLPIAEQSVNGIFSNLALQWCRNPEALFAGFKRIIKPDGRLVFSTFGAETLQELKQAWMKADRHRHVNEFYGERELVCFLERAGFTEIKTVTKVYRPYYASVTDLMRELKTIGANNVADGRNKNMTTKTQLNTMTAAYEQYRCGQGLPATFAAILVSAKT